MTDDVPLICDIPPGGFLLVTTDRRLTVDEHQRLRLAVESGLRQGLLVLDKGIRVERVAGRAWPDAEFCAA